VPAALTRAYDPPYDVCVLEKALTATAALSADIVSYSRSKGLYGGISVDGAVVAVRAG